MKIGDVIFYQGEQGVVEKLVGSCVYVRVFREDWKFIDSVFSPRRSGLYSHHTIHVDLMDYYKSKSFLSYLIYSIPGILHAIKKEPFFFLALLCVIILGAIVLILAGTWLISFLGTL